LIVSERDVIACSNYQSRNGSDKSKRARLHFVALHKMIYRMKQGRGRAFREYPAVLKPPTLVIRAPYEPVFSRNVIAIGRQLPLCGLPAAQWNHVDGRAFLYGYIGHC
jgi:hypothetical protein